MNDLRPNTDLDRVMLDDEWYWAPAPADYRPVHGPDWRREVLDQLARERAAEARGRAAARPAPATWPRWRRCWRCKRRSWRDSSWQRCCIYSNTEKRRCAMQ